MLGECVHMEDLVYFFLGDIQNTVIKVCILTKLENNCTNNFLPGNLACTSCIMHLESKIMLKMTLLVADDFLEVARHVNILD